MDERNFDRLTVALTGDGSTRRGVLGGLAGLLGIAGIGGLDVLDAEAKKNNKDKQIKKLRKRLRRRRRQNNQNNGVTIVEGATNLFPAGFDLSGATLAQVLSLLGLTNDPAGIASLTDILGAGLVANLVGGLGLVCEPDNKGLLRLCATGFCNGANECADCPNGQICGDDDGLAGFVCCVEGAVCADVGCILE